MANEQIDFKQSIVRGVDPGNRDIVQQINSRTVSMMMYTTPVNAGWITAKILKKAGYALAAFTFTINRDFFRLEPGDLFKLSYTKFGIINMVCRVAQITEENLQSENITVTAIEDIDYISNAVTIIPPTGQAILPDEILIALTHTGVIETPYVSSGNILGVVPLAAREKNIELGYYLYMSIDDGTSYTKIATITTYNPFGILVLPYPITHQIDDYLGFQIDFTNDDVDIIQTITKAQLCGGTNLALLGVEIISFQTITPVSTNRYALSGIYRGRFDTEVVEHLVSDTFFYLGTAHYQKVEHPEILAGTTRKFKLVPFSNKTASDISDAFPVSLTIEGRAKKPYKPINFTANGVFDLENPLYVDDIVLTWDPRLRGDGAGISSEVFDVNEAPVATPASGYEGYFKVEVYVADVLMRTVDSIADFTWTYTDIMNLADNGALAEEIVFKVSNYRNETGHDYESAQTEITVQLI